MCIMAARIGLLIVNISLVIVNLLIKWCGVCAGAGTAAGGGRWQQVK